MSFVTLSIAYELARLVEPVIRRIAVKDRTLADQLRRAIASIPLNLAEGNELCDRSRLHHFRAAAGSAREVEAALRTAEALRYVDMADIATALHYADRLHALLYMLIHPRSKR